MNESTSSTIAVYRDIADWLTCLDIAYTHLKATGWTFIQTLRYGIDQFGRTDHRKAELYELAAAQLGVSPRTLANYVSLARSPVAEIAQGLELEFSHAHAALGLEPDAAHDLLSTAAEQGWEAAQVRREAWARKQASHNNMRSDLNGNGATEIAYPVPCETLTALRPVEHGRLICHDARDPQAHIEVTVDGGTLYVEMQGTFVQFTLPKGYGIYRR